MLEWREAIAGSLQLAQQQGADWQIHSDFFSAVLALLDGQSSALPDDHPYAPALAEIQADIAAGGRQKHDAPENEEEDTDDELPFNPELIPRSIAALSAGPQARKAHMQYLATLEQQTTDEGLKVLIETIQLGLLGSDLAQLGQDLSGAYRQAWEMIVLGVAAGGVDPRQLEIVVQNTLVVLGPAPEKRDAWREALVQIKGQATEGGQQAFVALLDTVIGLLDAGGNPAGLGTNLTGIFAQVWQAIVQHLTS